MSSVPDLSAKESQEKVPKTDQNDTNNNDIEEIKPNKTSQTTFSTHLCPNYVKALKAKFLKYKAGKVILEKDDSTGIAIITLDNQGRKNALSGSMMIELMDVVDELERWDKVSIVTFCDAH